MRPCGKTKALLRFAAGSALLKKTMETLVGRTKHALYVRQHPTRPRLPSEQGESSRIRPCLRRQKRKDAVRSRPLHCDGLYATPFVLTECAQTKNSKFLPHTEGHSNRKFLPAKLSSQLTIINLIQRVPAPPLLHGHAGSTTNTAAPRAKYPHNSCLHFNCANDI